MVPTRFPYFPEQLTVRFALQLAFDPPLEPLQVQVQGPVPFTVGVPPVVQRLVVGFVLTVVP